VDHGERGARAYNGGLGRSPQRDPGAEPPEAGDIFILKVHFFRSSCGILQQHQLLISQRAIITTTQISINCTLK